MSDETNDTGDQERLRLQWPTFRGSAVGWGILAVSQVLFIAAVALSVVRSGEGWTVVSGLLIAASVVVAAVFVTGTVATIRRPRPAPPAVDR